MIYKKAIKTDISSVIAYFRNRRISLIDLSKISTIF
jgi:hypothetical protein